MGRIIPRAIHVWHLAIQGFKNQHQDIEVGSDMSYWPGQLTVLDK